MHIARRLYVYFLSGVSLAFVLVGLQSLVQVVLESIGLGGEVVAGDPGNSARLSGALALVGVGTPVWLLHWWFAERSIRSDRDDAEAERQSGIRALYFALLLGVLLATVALAASELSVRILSTGLDVGYFGSSLGALIATILVAGAAWVYHAALRRRDLSAAPMRDAAAWVPRAYLYGAAFLGGVWALTSVVTLTEAAVRVAFGQTFDPYLWVRAVGPVVIGTVVWVTHAWYAGRLRADPGWRGASERPARIRLAYFVAFVVVGVAGTIAAATRVLEVPLGMALGTGGPGSVVIPTMLAGVLSLIPFAVAGWWFHVRSLRREGTQEVAPDRPALNFRLEHVAVALTALAFAATGTARLIAITLDVLFGSPSPFGGSGVAHEVATLVPWAILGGAIWLWAWIPVERRRIADPATEAASTVRRAALLIVLAVSVLAGLSSVALLLYRLFGFLLGAGLSGDALVELSAPTGILVVAVVAGLYHGLALRRDLAIAPTTPAVVGDGADAVVGEALSIPPDAAWESEGGVVLPERLALTLRGPDGPDMDAALEAARTALPEGYRLERD